jgi:hypothetical protein
MVIGTEEQTVGGELPRLNVDVWNTGGMAFRFAKDNDLSLNDVTIRLVNLTLAQSGSEALIRLQILGSAFNSEAGRFILGHELNYDAEGPRRIYDRRSFPSIPFAPRQWAIL